MNEILKKIVSEDQELKNLFATLYVDMGAEKVCHVLQFVEEQKKEIIEVPVSNQILKIKEALMEKRGVYFEEKEISDFAIEYGKQNFNFLD